MHDFYIRLATRRSLRRSTIRARGSVQSVGADRAVKISMSVSFLFDFPLRLRLRYSHEASVCERSGEDCCSAVLVLEKYWRLLLLCLRSDAKTAGVVRVRQDTEYVNEEALIILMRRGSLSLSSTGFSKS